MTRRMFVLVASLFAPLVLAFGLVMGDAIGSALQEIAPSGRRSVIGLGLPVPPEPPEAIGPRPGSVNVAPAPPDRANVLPVPPAPREEGLLGELTQARLSGEDRDAFYLAAEANRRTESGGTPSFSALRTTAGREHRASYGLGQLGVREHLNELLSLTDRQLATLHIARAELTSMQARGAGASAWFRVLVQEHAHPDLGAQVELDGEETRRAIELGRAGDRRALTEAFGARFARQTGIHRNGLGELADTRALARREARELFRSLHRRLFGSVFDPEHRDASRMGRVAGEVALRRPDIHVLVERMGGDVGARVSVAHYLGVGDLGENLLGWYARGAQTAVGRERFVEILRLADPISTRLRELLNFENAMDAVVGVRDLRGIERARMLARIARCFHGAPARARRAFFFDDDRSRPRATTASELESAIQEYRLARTWSDARLQQAFDALLRERMSSQSPAP